MSETTEEKFKKAAEAQGIDPNNIAPSAMGTTKNGVSQAEEIEKAKEEAKPEATETEATTGSRRGRRS